MRKSHNKVKHERDYKMIVVGIICQRNYPLNEQTKLVLIDDDETVRPVKFLGENLEFFEVGIDEKPIASVAFSKKGNVLFIAKRKINEN